MIAFVPQREHGSHFFEGPDPPGYAPAVAHSFHKKIHQNDQFCIYRDVKLNFILIYV